MRSRPMFILAALVPLALASASAAADPPAAAPVSQPSSVPSPLASATPEAPKKEWDFSFTLAGYIVPDDRDYLQPTFTADYDTLHLELRYNYEDIDTGSVWCGYNFSAGTDLTVDFTPMIGVVAGDTDGLAPGYELTLTYGKFELSTEGEFVFDVQESSDSFFYTWTELSFAPVDWFRFGLVIQRNKTTDTRFDVDRGLLFGLSHDNLSFTTYLFNIGWDDPMVVLSLEIDF